MNENYYKTKIAYTKDYEKFKRLFFNRNLNENHILYLIESMKKYGFLLPILVTENFYVADGQHRLEAAKRANIEISYIVTNIKDNDLPFLISTISTIQKWTIVDFYNLWFKLENPTFLWIGDLLKEYNTTLPELYQFLKFLVYGSTITKKFKEGNLDFTTIQKNKLIQRLKNYNEFIDFKNEFKLLTNYQKREIIRLVSHPEYNHNRMMNNLNKDAVSLLNCISTIDFAYQLQQLYNRGEKEQLHFVKIKASFGKSKLKKYNLAI